MTDNSSTYQQQLAELIASLEADELAAKRARLTRLQRVVDVLGPDVGVTALQEAISLTGRYRFEEALDRILDALEHL